MLKWLIRNRLAAFQRKFDYNLDYARAILDADTAHSSTSPASAV